MELFARDGGAQILLSLRELDLVRATRVGTRIDTAIGLSSVARTDPETADRPGYGQNWA